jgi:hypothetical protein
MKYLSVVITALVIAPPIAPAQQEKTIVGYLGRAAEKLETKSSSLSKRAAQSATGSIVVREMLARDVTIQPGANGQYELGVDISGADQVTVTLTSLGDSDFSKVRIATAFAAPGEWYVLTSLTRGSGLAFLDHGAITVPVAGPVLKVLVFNDDIVPVKIRQLAVYTVVH